MWSTPAVWKQYNKMAVLHFFLVNSPLIYILFSLQIDETSLSWWERTSVSSLTLTVLIILGFLRKSNFRGKNLKLTITKYLMFWHFQMRGRILFRFQQFWFYLINWILNKLPKIFGNIESTKRPHFGKGKNRSIFVIIVTWIIYEAKKDLSLPIKCYFELFILNCPRAIYWHK